MSVIPAAGVTEIRYGGYQAPGLVSRTGPYMQPLELLLYLAYLTGYTNALKRAETVVLSHANEAERESD